MRSAILFTWMCVWLTINTFANDKTQQQLDSLWLVWKNPEKSDTDRLKAIDIYIRDRVVYNDPKKAFDLAQLEYNFAMDCKLQRFQAMALNIQGVSYWVRSNYDSALLYYKKALLIRKKENDKIGIGSLLNNIAIVEQKRGNYLNAIEHNYQSLKIAEASSNFSSISTSLNNIGGIYSDLQDLDRALFYYKKSLDVLKNTNDKYELSNALNNIANTYADLKKSSIAIDYYRKVLKLSYELDDEMSTSSTLLNLGLCFIDMNENDSAMSCFAKCLSMMENLGDIEGIALVYNGIAKINYQNHDYSKAIDYSKKAMQIGRELKSNIIIRNASNKLYQCFKEQGNYKLALQMLEEYNSVNDSLINDYNHKALIRSQLQYDFDKKADIIKQQNKIKDLKLSRRGYTIAALVLFAFLSFLIYYQRIKNNKLKSAKKNIELEHKLLGSQMNTHFTFNAINSIQEYILNNQNEKAHNLLSEFSKLMRMVLVHNRKKIISIADEIELLKKYILLEEERIKDKIHFTIINTNEVDLENIEIPSLLIQPIIENAIWHGLRFQKETKNIELIFTKQANNLLKIEVTDNGIGLLNTENSIPKSSHGLSIVKERIRLLYAKSPELDFFEFKNNSGKAGATIIIIIPIINEFE